MGMDHVSGQVSSARCWPAYLMHLHLIQFPVDAMACCANKAGASHMLAHAAIIMMGTVTLGTRNHCMDHRMAAAGTI